MNTMIGVISTVAPSIGVGLIFYFVIRSVMRADRREREYLRELDEQERIANVSSAAQHDDDDKK